MVHTLRTRNSTEVLQSALHMAMCAAMSEIQDRLQKRKERQQVIGLQPDGHLPIAFVKRRVIKMMNEGNGGID